MYNEIYRNSSRDFVMQVYKEKDIKNDMYIQYITKNIGKK